MDSHIFERILGRALGPGFALKLVGRYARRSIVDPPFDFDPVEITSFTSRCLRSRWTDRNSILGAHYNGEIQSGAILTGPPENKQPDRCAKLMFKGDSRAERFVSLCLFVGNL